jgi:hypothetical protein
MHGAGPLLVLLVSLLLCWLLAWLLLMLLLLLLLLLLLELLELFLVHDFIPQGPSSHVLQAQIQAASAVESGPSMCAKAVTASDT